MGKDCALQPSGTLHGAGWHWRSAEKENSAPSPRMASVEEGWGCYRGIDEDLMKKKKQFS